MNYTVKGRNRSIFEPSRPVAQLAEQRSPKPQVGGSIPSWPANWQGNLTNDVSSNVLIELVL